MSKSMPMGSRNILVTLIDGMRSQQQRNQICQSTIEEIRHASVQPMSPSQLHARFLMCSFPPASLQYANGASLLFIFAVSLVSPSLG